ncbi:unknown [Bacteroides sp. CAG:1060]|nr:unknown [Bacteroides sp. CAG:1060]
MFNNELFLLRFGKYMKQLLSIKEKALKIVKSVRGSTAAGINISLLPRDAAAGNLPVVLYGKRPFFWCLLDFR